MSQNCATIIKKNTFRIMSDGIKRRRMLIFHDPLTKPSFIPTAGVNLTSFEHPEHFALHLQLFTWLSHFLKDCKLFEDRAHD